VVWRLFTSAHWPLGTLDAKGFPNIDTTMSDNSESGNVGQKAKQDPTSTVQEKTSAVSRFPSLEDEYVKAELHNGLVMFADIREFSSYMDANSDYAISLLACFRRVLFQHLSAKSLKANENGRYTTFAKELGDGVMMIWIAEQGSITDISVEEITGLAFVSQEIVRRFYELSADFAPEKYHVGIGIAIGSFQRLLYRDKSNPTIFRYRDYCGSTINMAARLESLSRPNGVTVSFNALPLNKKKDIEARITAQDFKEVTHEIRGLGKTQLFQWKFDLESASTNDQLSTPKADPSGANQSSGSKPA
jgi:class 3 adenylate cyclase